MLHQLLSSREPEQLTQERWMLLKERLTQPTGMQRAPEAQATVDLQCQSLALYHYKTCPFCMKVRQEMRRLSLNIRHIDAQPEGKDRAALIAGGGLAKVPCLKITDEAGAAQRILPPSKRKKIISKSEVEEIVAKIARTGARIYEVSISYHGRTYHEGKKIGWKDGVSAIRCILKYGFFNSRVEVGRVES